MLLPRSQLIATQLFGLKLQHRTLHWSRVLTPTCSIRELPQYLLDVELQVEGIELGAGLSMHRHWSPLEQEPVLLPAALKLSLPPSK